METFAQLLLALLFVGVVRAYINGGWPGVNHFLRLKVVGS